MLDRGRLQAVLRRNTLRVAEEVLYERLKQWAQHQLRCSDPEVAVNDGHIRKFLGDHLWLVRYAHMTAEEFSTGPARDDILTDKVHLVACNGSLKLKRLLLTNQLRRSSTFCCSFALDNVVTRSWSACHC